MEIEIEINKSIEQNADKYYENAKKINKKISRGKEVIKQFKEKLNNINVNKEKRDTKIQEKEKAQVKKEWYEKFRWFYSSEGFLCIGGKDATTNEIIIKKHTEKEEFVAHTEMPGSPFFVIKADKKVPGKKTKEELAISTASYSKAWKLGLSFADVFIVKGNQISKDVSLPKGSFMVKGKRENHSSVLELGIGLLKSLQVMGGPIEAVKKHCEKFIVIKPGSFKNSELAKKIEKQLGIKNRLDDIIRVMPSGTSSLS